MKKVIKLLLVLFPVMVIGQTTTQNYIKTTTYKQGFTEGTVPLNPTPVQAAQSTTYFDGLGRPIQQIAGQRSNTGKDIITHIKYDSFGRQTEEYLPFKSANTNMAFDPLAETNVLSYYASPNPTVTGNPAMEATTNPFSKKELEASPLNRVLRQAAPGNDWSLGSGHEIKMGYPTNGAEEVKLFKANTSWDAGSGLYVISLLNNNYYAPNRLYKTVTYDENTAAAPIETNGSTVEFKNKEGQVVLKRTYSTVGAGSANEKHDTYYVYDSYGNLTYVIPPKAVDLIGTSTGMQANLTSVAVVTPGTSLSLEATNSIQLSVGFHAQTGSTFSAVIDPGTQGILDNLCYQYKYDHRNRLVEKKLPGKQWEFIVYDKLDRVVATGPVNSPFSDITSSGWIITKYDVFSRAVYTGWMNATAATASGRATLQAAQNNPALTTINESKQSSGTLDGIAAYYTNVVAPVAFKLLTVNYYDNYTFPTGGITIPTTVEGQTTLTTNEVKGLTTASWTRVLTTSTSTAGETTATFYEPKARPVRTYTQNYLGGYTYTDSNLDAFSGQLKYSITRHKRTAADTELMTKEIFTYSPQDRLLTQTHQINNGVIEVLVDNSYDELGQLIIKKVGGNTQKIDYAYNIRGWLKEINKVGGLTQGTDPKDLFAFKINYNTPTVGATPLYNGNISETQWTTNSDPAGMIRSYGYRYDNLNRLKEGTYKKATALSNAYNEALLYDKNGNIVKLTRNGNSETLQQIDDLAYTYANNNNSNQLVKVIDSSNKTIGFKDNTATTDDYSYDPNGNMTADANKNITAITYNHLNLPKKITFATTGNIEYIYNAAGQKLQKIVNETGKTAIKTDYLGGYQYDNIVLKFFPTAEGYVEPSGSSYKYIYQYKDHLGNVRLSYDKTLAIKEENNYYPFGLKHEGYNTVKTGVENKYKYNSKELQDELELNMYDYSARNYDPALGRFVNMDDHSENHYSSSPYTYAYNNPIIFVDPDGKDGVVTGTGTKDDPYMIKANYYYYGLNEDQKAGVKGAISDYNNGGKAMSFKNGDSEVFVKFNLTATEVENADKANERANADTVEVGDKTVRFGNTINSGTVDGENHLGNAGRKDITLDKQKTENLQKNAPGVSLSNIYKGTMIHEVGHNLGGNHNDPGNIMSYTYASERKSSSGCMGDCGTGVYDYSLSSVNPSGVRAITGRMGLTTQVEGSNGPTMSTYNIINSTYLTPKENKRVTEGSVGRLTLIQNK